MCSGGGSGGLIGGAGGGLLIITVTALLLRIAPVPVQAEQVVLLDTATEQTLEWTRFPYGPPAKTPGAERREAELGGVSVKIEAVNPPVTVVIYRSNSELAESFTSGLLRDRRRSLEAT
ncbi:hypothetical protein LSTR_LSTR010348 [Laodelphax striatellus]|uniref:Uncharacterized protein n=1 Tax=Laodelphax striatellus TaxID=195883 RepID=A0A482X0D5_LAOST|nr:hypothetical protein LSTR_LSTR010348 [Laodelphax striatellus]